MGRLITVTATMLFFYVGLLGLSAFVAYVYLPLIETLTRETVGQLRVAMSVMAWLIILPLIVTLLLTLRNLMRSFFWSEMRHHEIRMKQSNASKE